MCSHNVDWAITTCIWEEFISDTSTFHCDDGGKPSSALSLGKKLIFEIWDTRSLYGFLLGVLGFFTAKEECIEVGKQRMK